MSRSVPLVRKEWRRILQRLRRDGVESACEHVTRLIETGSYPIIFGLKLIRYLSRHDEQEAAGRVIRALYRTGVKDPLLDERHTTWLYLTGRRKPAISQALKNARHWQVSYIVHHVGTLYRMMFKRTGSDYYQKQALHYWRLAHILVEQEEQKEANQKRHDQSRAEAKKGRVCRHT